MATAKDIIIKPINARTANAKCKQIHYSGKVVPNSQLHFGVFLNGKLEGVMQFGPSINKKGTINLVGGTKFNEFIELNRMAFSDVLPRFSESRAIGITMRLIKKVYPQVKWVISFSDGTQCGDGTIYRASGFYLVGINESKSMRIHPITGEVMHDIQAHHLMIDRHEFRKWESHKGFMLKYIYFIDKSYKEQLTVPILPFSEIDKQGAGMYKGERVTLQERRMTKASSSDQLEGGGAIPTHTLQPSPAGGE